MAEPRYQARDIASLFTQRVKVLASFRVDEIVYEYTNEAIGGEQ